MLLPIFSLLRMCFSAVQQSSLLLLCVHSAVCHLPGTCCDMTVLLHADCAHGNVFAAYQFAEGLQRRALSNFANSGVSVRTGVRVVEVNQHDISLANGDKIEYGVCVWSTGRIHNCDCAHVLHVWALSGEAGCVSWRLAGAVSTVTNYGNCQEECLQ